MGLPYLLIELFTLVCLWCGRTVARSLARSVYGRVITKFSRIGRLPHFLRYGTPPTRGAKLRARSSAIKRNVFTLFKKDIFFIQCLYGYVIVTLKLSCKDIPGSMISRANESWFKWKKKKCELKFWLNCRGLLTSTDTSLTSSQVIFFSNGFDTFSFFMPRFY